MCRYDEDWAWTVMSTDTSYVHEVDTPCEDCGRAIVAGEPLVKYTGDKTGGEEDDRPYVSVIKPLAPGDWFDDDDDDPYLVIQEGDDAVWEALGFVVSEVRDPRERNGNIVYAYQCQQCYEANYWLQQVCDQHTVCVTAVDLSEHVDEYEPDLLGPHFLAMQRACTNRWRHRGGRRMHPTVVRRLSRHAVRHAVAVGLHP